jgi:hypothetical protein
VGGRKLREAGVEEEEWEGKKGERGEGGVITGEVFLCFPRGRSNYQGVFPGFRGGFPYSIFIKHSYLETA